MTNNVAMVILLAVCNLLVKPIEKRPKNLAHIWKLNLYCN